MSNFNYETINIFYLPKCKVLVAGSKNANKIKLFDMSKMNRDRLTDCSSNELDIEFQAKYFDKLCNNNDDDNEEVLIAASSSKISLYNVERNLSMSHLKTANSPKGEITCLKSLPGEKFATGSSASKIFLWNKDLVKEREFTHNGSISSLGYTYLGDFLISCCSEENTVRVWKVNHIEYVKEIQEDDNLERIVVFHSGHFALKTTSLFGFKYNYYHGLKLEPMNTVSDTNFNQDFELINDSRYATFSTSKLNVIRYNS